MYAGNAVAPTPVTRSQSLSSAWEQFAAADKELFDARERRRESDHQFGQACEALSHAENVWAKASQELAQIMMQEAPAQLAAQTASQQPQQDCAPPSYAGAIGGALKSRC